MNLGEAPRRTGDAGTASIRLEPDTLDGGREQLAWEVRRILGDGPKEVVLIATDVEFLPLEGVALLLVLRNEAAAQGASVRLVDCSDVVQRRLRITGLASILT